MRIAPTGDSSIRAVGVCIRPCGTISTMTPVSSTNACAGAVRESGVGDARAEPLRDGLSLHEKTTVERTVISAAIGGTHLVGRIEGVSLRTRRLGLDRRTETILVSDPCLQVAPGTNRPLVHEPTTLPRVGCCHRDG